MTPIRLFTAALIALFLTQGAGPARAQAAPPSAATEQVVLAGGCFWGMQAVFGDLAGVTNVVAGYSGGSAATAHYDIVSTGRTGHAESVRVTFDPARISFHQILQVFFSVAHDPTQLDRQGPDDGTQYRSVVFYENAAQRSETLAYIARLQARHAFRAPIVTQVVPLRAFYPAESYHQDFVARHPDNPYVVFNDLPKLRALHAQFPALVKAGT